MFKISVDEGSTDLSLFVVGFDILHAQPSLNQDEPQPRIVCLPEPDFASSMILHGSVLALDANDFPNAFYSPMTLTSTRLGRLPSNSP